MTHISGNSLWKGIIPSRKVGTTVIYSVTGKETTGNEASDMFDFVIVMRSGDHVILRHGCKQFLFLWDEDYKSPREISQKYGGLSMEVRLTMAVRSQQRAK